VQVPAHFDAEVLSGVLREMRRGLLDKGAAEIALLEAVRLPVDRLALPGMVAEAYGLRDRIRAYDAFYVVLARRSSALLITADGPLARAAEGLVEVQLIE
jgi:predicted nucleic acid-binding protein